MNLTFCRHILPSTRKCQSPALTGRLYCHHHARLYRRGSGFHAPNLLPKRIPALELPGSLPATPTAVQSRISTILQTLATGPHRSPPRHRLSLHPPATHKPRTAQNKSRSLICPYN